MSIVEHHLRLPQSFRRNLGSEQEKHAVRKMLRQAKLVTVCEEARCPNIGECFSSGTATFMIMGDTCTRSCNFCSVKTGRPSALSDGEPLQLAETIRNLKLQHAVITSVDRDELKDCGAGHWVKCIEAVRNLNPLTTIEILTPDFKGQEALIDMILDAKPDVFNHNMETIPRLYHALRPQSYFETTQKLLQYVAQSGHAAVKTGIMVGLGENDDEVKETMRIAKDAGVHIFTIGQYLRPSRKHWSVQRYVSDESYEEFKNYGAELGFTHVFAGAFVRSSYHAAEAMQRHHSAPRTRPLTVL